MTSRWTVFLDRDGVLNPKSPPGDYVKTPEAFGWLPGALEALRLLHDADARVIVVTNQQGLAKGLIEQENLEAIHQRVRIEAAAAGGALDGIYVCPHLAGTCDCRKPGVRLFHDARRDFPDIDFQRSVVVGDSESDIQAGQRLGARTVFIRRPDSVVPPGADAEAPDLLGAVRERILGWV